MSGDQGEGESTGAGKEQSPEWELQVLSYKGSGPWDFYTLFQTKKMTPPLVRDALTAWGSRGTGQTASHIEGAVKATAEPPSAKLSLKCEASKPS